MIKFGVRQLAHGAEEAIVARADRERPEVTLQCVRIARLDKAHGQRFSTARPQDIGMLPEVVEPKRDHGWAPSIKKSRRSASPLRGDADLTAFTPAKTAFRLRNKCHPGRGRHHAGHGRSIQPARAVHADAPARAEGFRRFERKRRNHDDSSSIHVYTWTFSSPKANLLPAICRLSRLSTNDTLYGLT